MLSEPERTFFNSRRVAHLATADAMGVPHVVPVCFAIDETTLYITIDTKPKRRDGRDLKRLRNIIENPAVTVIADHYDGADWSKLGWVMIRGRAEILYEGGEHDVAQELLRQRYAPYREMALAPLPVIALRIERVTSWGDLKS